MRRRDRKVVLGRLLGEGVEPKKCEASCWFGPHKEPFACDEKCNLGGSRIWAR
jgi:hypothetical protein